MYTAKRDREILRERSATCKKCGLTARNQFEPDDSLNHAHDNSFVAESDSKNSSANRNQIQISNSQKVSARTKALYFYSDWLKVP
jgi:hypothetical protein